jgi:hypothetical protein
MTTVNYPSPVTVNGYSCKNCTDVDYAKQHIDPAHPKDGPYGVDAKTQPATPASFAKAVEKPAVVLGGAFAGVSATANANTAATATQGLRLDVSA